MLQAKKLCGFVEHLGSQVRVTEGGIDFFGLELRVTDSGMDFFGSGRLVIYFLYSIFVSVSISKDS